MATKLEPKMVECKCGHVFESTINKAWCEKCCRPVFYHARDQKRHQWGHYYMVTMMVTALMFVTYLFLEIIARPLLSL